MARNGVVEFHENGRDYRWHVPSGEVVSATSALIATGIHNLPQARVAVLTWQAIHHIHANIGHREAREIASQSARETVPDFVQEKLL